MANGYYISYQITSTNSNNGVLSLKFTLTDGTNTGSLITETSVPTLDTAQPSASNFEWYYAVPPVFAFEQDIEMNLFRQIVDLDSSITVGPDYKVKVEFTATDITNVLIDSSGVEIGANSMTFPKTNSDDNAQVEYSGSNDIYNVTMIYTIPNTGTSNANGSLSFELVLTDGVSGNNTITLNPANSSNTAVTITVDTRASRLVSGTVNTLGNKITLEYDEDISGNTVTNNGTTGFTISGINSAGNTLSLSNPTPVLAVALKSFSI